MEARRIGGGILLAVSVAVAVIVDKMDVQLTDAQGLALLLACAFFALIGLALVFWPQKKRPTAPPPHIDQSVTSHDQTGGITTHSVNVRNDEG